MTFDRALEHSLDGDAVLFLAAGFSLGAKSARGGFKSGSQFAAHLGGKVSMPESTELQDAAEAFLERFGEGELNRELLLAFRATEVTPHHLSVAKVPWRRVYTTNYDSVFE